MKKCDYSYPAASSSVIRNMCLDPAENQDLGGTIVEDTGGDDAGAEGASDTGGGVDFNNVFGEGGDKPSKPINKSGLPAQIKPKLQPKQPNNEPTTAKQNQPGDTDGKGEGEDNQEGGEENNQDNKGENRENSDTAGDIKPRRDYTGFSEQETKLLKQVPNKVFAELAPYLKNLNTQITAAKADKAQVAELTKQLEGKSLPQNWYDHPQAYLLSPEYNTVNQQFRRAQAEEGALRQALSKIKAKQGFTVINGWDDKTGQPIYSEEYEPDDTAEGAIFGMLSEASAKKISLGNQGKQIAENFKSKHQAIAQNFSSEVDKHINNMAPDHRPTEDQIKMYLDSIPDAWKGHPQSKDAGKMFGIILNLGKALNALHSKQQVKAAANNDKKLAGPAAKVSRPGISSNGKSSKNEIDFSSLESEFKGD
jgi:hypothetical protein